METYSNNTSRFGARKIRTSPRKMRTSRYFRREPVIFLPRITRIFTNIKGAQYSCLLVTFVATKNLPS